MMNYVNYIYIYIVYKDKEKAREVKFRQQANEKRVRAPEREVVNKIYKLFEQKKNYTFSKLSFLTDQPDVISLMIYYFLYIYNI